MAPNRKLIEVSLPLEAINAQSAREKSIRHGHPSTLHLWWARRPLATARAILFAQLVDDPSNFLDVYRAEAERNDNEHPLRWAELRVKQERERLFSLIVRMVNWDNLNDSALFDEVRREIVRSTGGNPPPILDPFAGGGTIPLEAQRLGLEATASDLNPVAVLINKALMDFPGRFVGLPPAFPGASSSRNAWTGSTGLAEDVRRYGTALRDEAERELRHLYPAIELEGGHSANVIAWLWARTVRCANPACGVQLPLVRSWWLGKKKGREAVLVPRVEGSRVRFSIGSSLDQVATPLTGTVAGGNAVCVACGASIPNAYLRAQATDGSLGAQLIAVVAEGDRRRHYLPANDEQEAVALGVARPDDLPDQLVPTKNHDVDRLPMYGMPRWSDAFTARQLVSFETLSGLLEKTRDRIVADALSSGWTRGVGLEAGGSDAVAYADALATYLGLGISKIRGNQNALTPWRSDAKNEGVGHLFSRQSIQMVWDYAEGALFGQSAGSLGRQFDNIAEILERLPSGPRPTVTQSDAASRDLGGYVLSTDPPYYDNIGYSDLSDYFYVWLRRDLQFIHPELLSTMLVPKAEELVANPTRHGGKAGAKKFFETGFESVFARAREGARLDFPMTVYYAFKQSETDDTGTASTGWETILGSMIRAGWTVSATWPVRSELGNRLVASGTNALASSVVLSLRPRPTDASTTDRRGFISAMKRELGPALRELQMGGIAPVDLPQSAIGPGMAVFSRYSKVIESDGSDMSVRSALARINEVLDELLTEQEGDFDPPTRFAIAWYRGNGYEGGAYGDAENLARARATAVASMEREGILSARGGKVHLLRPIEFPMDYDVTLDPHTSAWEALHHAIRIQESAGIPAAGAFLLTASRRPDGAVDLDLVKELAYLLFQVAEKNAWTKDAISFNGVATSWSDLLESGRSVGAESTTLTLDFDGLDAEAR